ncbi:MAG: prolyl oligopeptidase family serine peptidase [Planctomycetales bacterium]|nr:prolyl oligopeptidase family serine peptidase [Planctomycetales bacterium]
MLKPTRFAVLIAAFVFAGVLTLTPHSAGAQEAGQQLSASVSVSASFASRYWLYLPQKYEQQEQWPLLLFLHGAGERGDDLEKVKVHGPPKLIAAGKHFPFIVVSPQCEADKWWEAAELSALLDHLEKTLKVDPRRIYVTGLSMGGFGTWSLATRDAHRFAAIAPVCGGGNAIRVRYAPFTAPAWAFHGAKDQAVPLSESEEMVAAIKQKGVEAKLTIYPEAGHDSWTETYNNPQLYEWLLSHHK